MSCPIGPEELSKLELFIGFCSQKPELLNLPQLKFFKDFIEKLGGKVPEGSANFGPDDNTEQKPQPTNVETEPPKPESDPESDVDIDDTGCVEPDNDPEQPMGDANKVPTEDELEKAGEFRSQAAAHYSEQRYEDAVAAYEQAILLNPTNALYYAKRGQAYLKLNKPNACIRDCSGALTLNCDSAAAYKFRGRAHRLLGDWQSAAKDLRQACKIDFDEEADEWLREVQPNAKKLEAHKIKQERKKAERLLRERQERVRRAQEANKRAAEEQKRQEQTYASAHDSAGQNPFAGAGGRPNAGAGASGFSQADILDAFKDPEVAAAFQDIMSNPANVVKYQDNPKIMNIITKVGAAMGGGLGGGVPGGAPGGFPGGFPGMFPGAGGFPNFQSQPPPSQPNKPSPDFQDDGLD